MKRPSYSSCTKLYEIAVRRCTKACTKSFLSLIEVVFELLVSLKIKASGIAQVYEAVCSFYHMGRTLR